MACLCRCAPKRAANYARAGGTATRADAPDAPYSRDGQAPGHG